MEKTVKQRMMESLIAFGKMYQLPMPTADYLETLQAALHAYKWRLSEFNNVLNLLLKDDKYAEFARFGKYPTIHDYLRIKQRINSKPFYDSLSAYLSGDWWEKDNVLALASPAQATAIMQAGGLTTLYQRATSDRAIPVYKLVDIVAENESATPTEATDTGHRLGAPTTMKLSLARCVLNS